MDQAPLKILIADDHAIFRRGLRMTLARFDAPVEIHEAAALPSLMELIDIHRQSGVGIVILDLQMPGMTPVEGLMAVRGSVPHTPILVLTASESRDDIFQCLAAGASGYIAKSAGIDDIFEAIRVIRAGGVYVPRELLLGAPTLALTTSVAEPYASPTQSSNSHLTVRQTEVLALVSDGHANKEIAFRLGMSEGTVKAHVAAIMRQLGARNRVQIVRAAEKLGLATARAR